ncbi:hypothetical protein EKK58_06020 [Candidatus Dependentiae bacterium]|nr:MAG: hypothetical protein EKK58_06020 [Candidatus Dependentiae bacterium]
MGRYYSGDIEGKFWFGVQASDDASFFGGTVCEPNYINYFFDTDDVDKIEEGLKKCEAMLGNNLQRLDDFFSSVNSYNDSHIIDKWYRDYNQVIIPSQVKELLEWYARYTLGKKIYDCVKDTGECSFEAEL